MLPIQACQRLDPDRFLAAWNEVQEVAGQVQTQALITPKGSADPHEAARWLEVVQKHFTDPNEQLSCTIRITSILVFAEKGWLGVFYNPEHGIWDEALRVLAVARCAVNEGFNKADVQRRLMSLEMPPTV